MVSRTPAPIEEPEALRRILENVPPAPPGETPLEASLDRFLSGDLLARIPSPRFDCSAMDGYALAGNPEGYPEGSTWEVAEGSISAGDVPREIKPGQALRIFTGAPVPPGTGAIAMQEDVELVEKGPTTRLELRTTCREGEFVRRTGEDLCAGQLLARSGCRLTPQAISAAASQGLATLPCPPRSRVGVLTTGNELVPPGEPLPPGGIHDSNHPLVTGLLARAGADIVDSARSRDDRETLLAAAGRLLDRGCEFLVSCGGVSVGDHDHVGWMAEQLGFRTIFWGVRMKPGKPFLFAVHPDGKWLCGLPGNPASAFVCFHRLVAPALRQRMGAAAGLVPPAVVTATLRGSLAGRDDRPHHLRGSLDERGVFSPAGIQQSHAISSLANCNALLRLAPGQSLADGQAVEVTPV